MIFWSLAWVAGFLAGGLVFAPIRARRVRLLAAGAFSTLALGLAALIGVRGAPAEALDARLDALIAQGPLALANHPSDARMAVLERDARENPLKAGAALAYGEALLAVGNTGLAERVLAQALRLEESARGYVSWAEARIALADGEITPPAERAITAALALDPTDPWAKSLRARWLTQQGDGAGALALWRETIGAARPGSRTRAGLALSAVNALSQPPRLSQSASAPPPGEDGDAAALRPEDMIARVSERLQADPTDLGAWLRLARAKAVLDGRAAGDEALNAASAVFADDGVALELLRFAPLTWPAGPLASPLPPGPTDQPDPTEIAP